MKIFNLSFIIILFVIISGSTANADIITLKKQGNAIVVTGNHTGNYTFPLVIQIPRTSDFTGKKLSFYVNDSTTTAKAIIISINTLINPSTTHYSLTIKSANQLSFCTGCKIGLPFYLKIDDVAVVTEGQTEPAFIDVDTDVSNAATAKLEKAIAEAEGKYGYPFYDALALKKLSVIDDLASIKAILTAYGITSSAQISTNPFLKDRFLKLYATHGSKNLAATALQSIGDLDVTNIADGLAKFLVKRTKQELSTAFFERFKDDLDKYPQLKILFPSTYTALKSIGDEIYNYAAYLEVLRESFQKDLALLLPNLQILVKDPCMDQVFSKYPEVRTIFSDALYIANEFKSGTHAGDILHSYATTAANKNDLDKIDPLVYPSIRSLDAISQSVRSKYGTNYWIGSDSLKMVFADTAAVKIFFGLLYQQIPDNTIIFGGSDVKTTLAGLATKITVLQNTYTPVFTNLLNKAKAVDQYYKQIKQSGQFKTNQPDYTDYYGLTNSFIDLFTQLTDVADKITGQTTTVSNDVRLYLNACRSLSNIYVDVYNKQYPSALLELTSIYSSLVLKEYNMLSSREKELQAKEDQETDAVLKKTYADQVAQIKSSLDAMDKYAKNQQTIVTVLGKYGNFVATVAKAQNSDEVQAAIEAVAMPAGSYSVKRNSQFNIAINAYVGPYLGYEKIHGFDHKASGGYGLTAPVGVAFSWGNIPWKKSSLSLFLSAIDIGAVTAYRFGNYQVKNAGDTTTLKTGAIPNIKLKNILSPGLFVSFGIPKWPLSIAGGFQLGPNLRKISVVDKNNTVLNPDTNGLANEYTDKLYTRWSISLVVDIPVINLYNKGK